MRDGLTLSPQDIEAPRFAFRRAAASFVHQNLPRQGWGRIIHASSPGPSAVISTLEFVDADLECHHNDHGSQDHFAFVKPSLSTQRHIPHNYAGPG
jgi:hypothetical protein